MTRLTDKVYAVEVPEGAKDLGCEKSMTGTPYLFYKFKDDELLNEYEDIRLPPGTWRFLFTTKAATEEDARKVVEHDDFIGGYKDYDTDRFHHEDPFIKATDSLDSLLHSKNLDPNKNYALIEKQSSDADSKGD